MSNVACHMRCSASSQCRPSTLLTQAQPCRWETHNVVVP